MTHGDHQLSWTVNIDKDKAVNELIDGFDAESVPGDIWWPTVWTAPVTRMALSIDGESIEALLRAAGQPAAPPWTALLP